MTSPDPIDATLLTARALVLRDLAATDVADQSAVSALESALEHRRWWLTQWPAGADFIAGLLAQDVQDELLTTRGRWPLCPLGHGSSPHALQIDPDLGGPDPHWVCEEVGRAVAALGELGAGPLGQS